MPSSTSKFREEPVVSDSTPSEPQEAPCNCCCHNKASHPDNFPHQHQDCSHCAAEVALPEPVPFPTTFSHDELLQAAYWVEDFMSRSMLNFFAIGPTGEAMKANKKLFGEGVFFGVRRMEWESEPGDDGTPGIPSGGRRIVDVLAQYAQDEGEIVYYFAPNGVPVFLFVFEDEPTITSLDMVRYERATFKLPNPFAQFKETYEPLLWN